MQAEGRGRWSIAKLSRVETASQRVSIADLRQLADLYQVTGERYEQLTMLARSARQRGWWDAYADTIQTDYAAYIELEAEADSLRCYDGLVVNGLLQTEDYAREIIRVGLMQFAPQSEVDRCVEVRRTRQRALTERADGTLRLWTIIDEAALRREVGGAAVTRRQYEHLIEVAELPNVMLQVLPFGAGAHPAITGTFALMSFPEHQIADVVYLDGLTSALYIEDDLQVHTYDLVFNQLAMNALGVDHSLALIADLARSPELGKNRNK